MTVSCFPKISTALKGFLSRSKASQNDSSDCNHPDEVCLASDVLKAAVEAKLNGARPQSKRIASLMPRLARAIDRKLKGRGKKLQMAGEADETVSVRRTGFESIFRHSAGKQFNLALQNRQVVARSRSEIETHVLLQSYLKTRYADNDVNSDEVIHPNCQRRFKTNTVLALAAI